MKRLPRHRVHYDSPWAFHIALESLEQFNKLIEKRRHACYVLHERLNEWVILGRFYFDSCGNVMKYTKDNIPAVMFPDIPPVFSKGGLYRYVENNLKPGQNDWFSCSMDSGIPPANIFCPVCGSPWAVENCHDTVVSHESGIVSLADNVGEKLSTVKTRWERSVCAVWRLQPGESVRNDVNIDHTIVDSENGRQYGWEVNKCGWIKADDSYQIRPGDEAMVNIWTYRHLKCHREHQAKTEQEYFRMIFADAGYKEIQMIQDRNQYCSCEYCAPWYRVIADSITFTIGWRKRVINIEVTAPHIDFIKLFPKEESTKATHYIHAWGREKCVEYLRTVKNAVL